MIRDKQVGIYKIRSNAVVPIKATRDSACFDLSAAFDESTAIDIFAYRDTSTGDPSKHVTFSHATRMTRNPFIDQKEDRRGLIIRLDAGERALIPTGLKFDLPSGWCLKVYPRSGTSYKRGLTLVNNVGIIDADYRDEIFIPIVNLSDKTQFIKSGERIAQCELSKVDPLVYFSEIDKEPGQVVSRSGGFGSTGQ